MNGYYNKYTLADFFMNPKLKQCFPQFTKAEAISYGTSKEYIVKKVANFYSNLLNAECNDLTINVVGAKKEIIEKIKSNKEFVESLFENSDIISKNISNKTKLYLSIGNLEQVLDNVDVRNEVFSQILQNIKYRETFGSKNERRKVEFPGYDGITKKSSFEYQEKEWQKKVGL